MNEIDFMTRSLIYMVLISLLKSSDLTSAEWSFVEASKHQFRSKIYGFSFSENTFVTVGMY